MEMVSFKGENLMKRILLYTFIILLFISIYQDFTNGKSFRTDNHESSPLHQETNYSIAHVKVLPGDTIITIVEKLNKDTQNELNMPIILKHFNELNPTTDPYDLKPYSIYYFPVYR